MVVENSGSGSDICSTSFARLRFNFAPLRALFAGLRIFFGPVRAFRARPRALIGGRGESAYRGN